MSLVLVVLVCASMHQYHSLIDFMGGDRVALLQAAGRNRHVREPVLCIHSDADRRARRQLIIPIPTATTTSYACNHDGVSLLQSSSSATTVGCVVGYGIRAVFFFATSKPQATVHEQKEEAAPESKQIS